MDILLQYLNEISEKVDLLKKIFSFGQKEKNIVFRGESCDYGNTSLVPSLLRGSNAHKERYLVDLLDDYNVSNSSNYFKRMIESQHYASQSRLLDVTHNILVALYFACVEDEDKDGYVKIILSPYIVSPSSSYIEEYYKLILEHESTSFFLENEVLLVETNFQNKRIIAQSGGFILFASREKAKIPPVLVQSVLIKADDKKEILNALNIFFSINYYALFPEKESISKSIGEKLEQNRTNHSKTEIDPNSILCSHLDFVNMVANGIYNQSLLQSGKGTDLEKRAESEMKRKRYIRSEIRQIEHVLKNYKENKKNEEVLHKQMNKLLNDYEREWGF